MSYTLQEPIDDVEGTQGTQRYDEYKCLYDTRSACNTLVEQTDKLEALQQSTIDAVNSVASALKDVNTSLSAINTALTTVNTSLDTINTKLDTIIDK